MKIYITYQILNYIYNEKMKKFLENNLIRAKYHINYIKLKIITKVYLKRTR